MVSALAIKESQLILPFFRSKKVPSGSPTKRRLIASNRRLNRRISRGETSTASSSTSMVQQLADVAQTARQLLGMEKEEPKEEGEDDDDGEEQCEQQPNDDDQQQQDGGQTSRASLDPLGQILLLGWVVRKKKHFTHEISVHRCKTRREHWQAWTNSNRIPPPLLASCWTRRRKSDSFKLDFLSKTSYPFPVANSPNCWMNCWQRGQLKWRKWTAAWRPTQWNERDLTVMAKAGHGWNNNRIMALPMFGPNREAPILLTSLTFLVGTSGGNPWQMNGFNF